MFEMSTSASHEILPMSGKIVRGKRQSEREREKESSAVDGEKDRPEGIDQPKGKCYSFVVQDIYPSSPSGAKPNAAYGKCIDWN